MAPASDREPLVTGAGVFQHLTIRYVVALLIVAVLSVGAHVAITAAVLTQDGNATDINRSGRQRMLSQRIALGLAGLDDVGARANSLDAATLSGLVDLMERSHDQLIHGHGPADPRGDRSSQLPPVVEDVFFGPDDLDAKVRSYLADVREVLDLSTRGEDHAAETEAIVRTAGDTSDDGLLATLDRAVSAYEEDADADVTGVLTVARVVLAVTLITLLLEGIFVFRPFVRSLRTRTEELDSARARLQAVLDNALVGVLTLDEAGRIADANRTAQVLLERHVDALAAIDLAALGATSGDSAALVEMVERSQRSAVPPTEVELRRGTGSFLAHVSAKRGLEQTGGFVSVVMTDETERAHAEKQLRHEANHDSLTGLPNRATFRRRVSAAIERADSTTSTFAVIFIDLDDFKTVNDSLGHEIGDALLVEVAARIVHSLRGHDLAARLGGDEFAVLLTGLEEVAIATTVAERILAALQAPVVVADRPLSVAASIGIVAGTDASDTVSLLSDADSAMYDAKRRGKNQIAVFNDAIRERVTQRLGFADDVRRAIADDEFALHYQPIVDLDTGATLGLEALIRWTHPERGFIPPDSFIPLAEETGQIIPIGWWVLQRSITQTFELRTDLGPAAPEYVSVNVSPIQLTAPDFVSGVADLMDGRLPPEALVLELTETAFMSDPVSIRRVLEDLRAMGVRVAIDDFGTGYSSLAYLESLPIDLVKIDREFVSQVDGSARQQALVAGMLQMANSLRLTAITEGIETDGQRSALTEIGYRMGQGYHFARPMPLAEFRRTIPARG
ncbi:EAL domain-containing protein [Euzebya tangerina]|uniref:EAL domain-containing protein n=1 Tax=Euzebya tangerina TaxID=591198 RepID=UPI0013C36D96|nr:EAL domain-containing protein [Euzebya tangerina]